MDRVTVAIAVPLEPELVERVAQADPRVEVLFHPELLPPPRYPNDHRGAEGFRRTPEQQRRWEEMLDRAEVLFGAPGDSPEGLGDAVRRHRRLRWVQAMAAGAGEQVRAAGLERADLERVAVTSSSGVHAVPLAEYCLLGLLAFTKDLPRLLDDQRQRRWSHYPMAELRDQTLLVVGFGQIGSEVARLATAFGMRVLAVNRSGATDSRHVAEAHPTERLPELLSRADAVVVTLPLTEDTRGLIDAEAIGRIKPGAVLVNVGRGAVIDEPALTAALREGRLAGAALDVFAEEPLPPSSPLWDMPNVLVTPHTAALSFRENERIVSLFIENLHRYLSGAELLRRINPQRPY